MSDNAVFLLVGAFVMGLICMTIGLGRTQHNSGYYIYSGAFTLLLVWTVVRIA